MSLAAWELDSKRIVRSGDVWGVGRVVYEMWELRQAKADHVHIYLFDSSSSPICHCIPSSWISWNCNDFSSAFKPGCNIIFFINWRLPSAEDAKQEVEYSVRHFVDNRYLAPKIVTFFFFFSNVLVFIINHILDRQIVISNEEEFLFLFVVIAFWGYLKISYQF